MFVGIVPWRTLRMNTCHHWRALSALFLLQTAPRNNKWGFSGMSVCVWSLRLCFIATSVSLSCGRLACFSRKMCSPLCLLVWIVFTYGLFVSRSVPSKQSHFLHRAPIISSTFEKSFYPPPSLPFSPFTSPHLSITLLSQRLLLLSLFPLHFLSLCLPSSLLKVCLHPTFHPVFLSSRPPSLFSACPLFSRLLFFLILTVSRS